MVVSTHAPPKVSFWYAPNCFTPFSLVKSIWRFLELFVFMSCTRGLSERLTPAFTRSNSLSTSRSPFWIIMNEWLSELDPKLSEIFSEDVKIMTACEPALVFLLQQSAMTGSESAGAQLIRFVAPFDVSRTMPAFCVMKSCMSDGSISFVLKYSELMRYVVPSEEPPAVTIATVEV